ncbi:MAG TPA: hypothetical protein PKU97_22430, partial [Kofleriaceae bacterium]|nr:hypothetical protein [Kofleriaceae bacterium]
VEDLEHRAIAEAERGADVGLEHDALGFVGGEHGLREAVLDARHVEIARGIREEDVLAGEPAEKGSDGRDASELRGKGERLSIGLS